MKEITFRELSITDFGIRFALDVVCSDMPFDLLMMKLKLDRNWAVNL